MAARMKHKNSCDSPEPLKVENAQILSFEPGTANVQWVESPTAQFEVVHGKRIPMKINLTLDRIKIYVKHASMDLFEKPLKNCGMKAHHNEKWRESL